MKAALSVTQLQALNVSESFVKLLTNIQKDFHNSFMADYPLYQLEMKYWYAEAKTNLKGVAPQDVLSTISIHINELSQAFYEAQQEKNVFYITRIRDYLNRYYELLDKQLEAMEKFMKQPAALAHILNQYWTISDLCQAFSLSQTVLDKLIKTEPVKKLLIQEAYPNRIVLRPEVTADTFIDAIATAAQAMKHQVPDKDKSYKALALSQKVAWVRDFESIEALKRELTAGNITDEIAVRFWVSYWTKLAEVSASTGQRLTDPRTNLAERSYAAFQSAQHMLNIQVGSVYAPDGLVEEVRKEVPALSKTLFVAQKLSLPGGEKIIHTWNPLIRSSKELEKALANIPLPPGLARALYEAFEVAKNDNQVLNHQNLQGKASVMSNLERVIKQYEGIGEAPGRLRTSDMTAYMRLVTAAEDGLHLLHEYWDQTDPGKLALEFFKCGIYVMYIDGILKLTTLSTLMGVSIASFPYVFPAVAAVYGIRKGVQFARDLKNEEHKRSYASYVGRGLPYQELL